MSTVADALTWDGVRCVISVFVVTVAKTAPRVDFRDGEVVPSAVRTYDLTADEDYLPGRHVFEYDLIFDDVPEELARYLEVCLRRACEGAVVAWLGFEGSFNYDYLLVPEVADQIYGVCAPGAPAELALEDEALVGERWREALQRYARALS
ncbi:hypothetical protein [Streptosporangium sp. H16]|uniref:hypothetical protein n=1 Tax=Streptosporangium sp. H16 TaxID=3444184 RepID=UPI003F79997A